MKNLDNKFILEADSLVPCLNKGSAVLFPTDTVPAIAVCPRFSSRIWELKKRPRSKPLILMGSTPDELFQNVLDIALKDAIPMAKTYWPGALTMILPSSKPALRQLNPISTSIGMRVPDCDFSRKLLDLSGPLATSSANIAGQPTSINEKDAWEYFPQLPLLGPLPWPISSGLASTVIAWVKPGCWKVLRKGSLDPLTF